MYPFLSQVGFSFPHLTLIPSHVFLCSKDNPYPFYPPPQECFDRLFVVTFWTFQRPSRMLHCHFAPPDHASTSSYIRRSPPNHTSPEPRPSRMVPQKTFVAAFNCQSEPLMSQIFSSPVPPAQKISCFYSIKSRVATASLSA